MNEQPSKPWLYQLIFLAAALAWGWCLVTAFNESLPEYTRWSSGILAVASLVLWIWDHKD